VQIDHLVFAGPDLDDAAASVTTILGVPPVPGGRHAGFGTHNRLLGLGGGAYLEVIGSDPAQGEPPEPRPFGIDGMAGPRLVAWAVRSTSIVADVARAGAAGIELGPITSMQRTRPDGVLLRWSLTPPQAGPLPFLIDWGETPHPTADLVSGPHLRALAVETPAAASVARTLDVLGVDVEVRSASTERLVATIEVAGAEVHFD
jgi:hypothetical protein